MNREVYRLLADVFEYPGTSLPGTVSRLLELVSDESPEIASAVASFQGVLAASGVAGLQEMYIQVFDFRGDCSLYIGHHLFGETGRHGAFLAELVGRYRELHVPVTEDLPDHLSFMLRYLAALEPGDEAAELIHACLLPALSRITAVKALSSSPYLPVLTALPALLQQSGNNLPQTGELAWINSSSSPFPMLQ